MVLAHKNKQEIRPVKLPLDMEQVKGFLAEEEGVALYEAARVSAGLGPVLEIGSYCGKSTIYLGLACQALRATLYAVDHHGGSEEHQPGEMFHDPSLFDANSAQMDSFRTFRRNIGAAGLSDTVVPLVAPSTLVARDWRTPLGMVFIDGGHSLEAALADYRGWSGHIVHGGVLAIHDLYPNPAEGGQAPYTIYQLALASGLFDPLPQVCSLGLLQRR
jgi:predicted O-methyltransferase YrrM